MHLSGLLVVVTILIALSFDFINGFHDAANSIATVVSTRVLSPRLAVVWAAVFNFVAAFRLRYRRRQDHRSGLVDPRQVTQYVILAALAGAIIWDLLTWWWGLPTSSSHALIGGLAGAAIARAGWQVLVREPKLHWPIIGTIPGLGDKWMSTLIFIVLAPLIGLLLGFGLMVAVSWIFHRNAPRTVDKLFRKLQLLSAAAYSLGHGGNDAQKTMGIIAGRSARRRLPRPRPICRRLGTLQVAHHPRRQRRHRAGDLFRRLAHRPHHGIEDHQAQTRRRILRRRRWRNHSVLPRL